VSYDRITKPKPSTQSKKMARLIFTPLNTPTRPDTRNDVMDSDDSVLHSQNFTNSSNSYRELSPTCWIQFTYSYVENRKTF